MYYQKLRTQQEKVGNAEGLIRLELHHNLRYNKGIKIHGGGTGCEDSSRIVDVNNPEIWEQ